MVKLFLAIIITSGLVSCSFKNDRDLSSPINIAWDGRKEITTFLYHRFGDDRYPSTNVSTADFEAHLKYLKSNDYQVLTFSEAIHYLKSSDAVKKTVVISIDDGFSSFYQRAMPLLKKYDFPATLFINTKTVGGNDYMNWEEINEVISLGIEIGNHTHSHDYFLNLSADDRYSQFTEELNLSQELIKKNTGTLPTVFAYPYGEFDEQMKSTVKKMGFIAAAAQNSGVIYKDTDLFACPRFPMAENYSAIDKFASKASMKALRTLENQPESIITDNRKPKLDISFERKNLMIDQLQCFIQGNHCSIQKLNRNDTIKVTVGAKTPLKNRRTLFTITVPDSTGNWHWYSHVWVNPAVR